MVTSVPSGNLLFFPGFSWDWKACRKSFLQPLPLRFCVSLLLNMNRTMCCFLKVQRPQNDPQELVSLQHTQNCLSPFSLTVPCCGIPGSRAWGRQVVLLEPAQKANHQQAHPTGLTFFEIFFVLHTISSEIKGVVALGKAHTSIQLKGERTRLHSWAGDEDHKHYTSSSRWSHNL